MPDEPIDVNSRAADGMVYRESGDLAVVRAYVRSAALAEGLPVDRAELLVLAVSELVTNTLQHTTGVGHVRVWRDGEQVVCEVADSGAARSIGEMPAAETRRGRGLAIAKRVVDELSQRTGVAGTVVQLRMAT